MTEIMCFQGDRGTGKTSKLIELADKHFSYIVVPDMQTVQVVAKKARKEGRKEDSVPSHLLRIRFWEVLWTRDKRRLHGRQR